MNRLIEPTDHRNHNDKTEENGKNKSPANAGTDPTRNKKRLIIVLILISSIALAEFILFAYGFFSDITLETEPEIFSERQDPFNVSAAQGINDTGNNYTVRLELYIENRGRIGAEDVTVTAWLEIKNSTGAVHRIDSTNTLEFDIIDKLERKQINITFQDVEVEFRNTIELYIHVRESDEITEKANATLKHDRDYYIESEVEFTFEDLLKRNNNIFFLAVGIEGLIVFVTIILSIVIVNDQLLALSCAALGLAPLFRIVNVATPMALNQLIFVTMSYGFLLIAVFIFIYVHNISLKDIGVTLKKWYIYIPLAIFLGFILAPIEFIILGSPAWIPEMSFYNLLVLTLVMVLFIGLAEELMYRSIIQTHLEKLLSPRAGLILTAILFGVMHGVWTSYIEFVFTFMAGLLFGYLFQRTRNLPFIAILHGTEDVVLFGILPFIM